MSDIGIEIVPPGARTKYSPLKDIRAFRESFYEVARASPPEDVVAYAYTNTSKVIGFAILKQDGKIRIVVHPQYDGTAIRERLRAIVMGRAHSLLN